MRAKINLLFFISIFFLGLIKREIQLPASQVIYLPDSCIIAESLEIRCSAGNRLSNNDFSLDKIIGKLSFSRLLDCDSLLIRYSALNLTRIKANNSIESGEIESEPFKRKGTTKEEKLELTYAGNLLRSVTISSHEGIKTESGLNLELDGKFGSESGIKAIISDEDIPIQPEGTTEELEELNKLFITAYSSHYSLSFGSFAYSSIGSHFLNYTRNLEGISATVDYGEIKWKGTFSGVNRKYITNFFYGIDGVLGPYELRDANNRTGISIVAGSEKVYLNGTLMRRGEQNDYIIDYSQGTITFTPKRIITKDSRIFVEFEYVDEGYFKTFIASSARLELFQGVSIGLEFFQEKDDPDKPAEGELDELEKLALKNAGNNDSLAIIPAFFISDSGDYNMTTDINGDTIFVYAGKDSGNYEVTFYDVGENKGAYKLDTRGFFVYVGKSRGRYSPYKQLYLPKINRYTGFIISLKPVQNIEFELEATRRAFDYNILSAIGDEKNSGIGYFLRSQAKDLAGFSFSFLLENREPNFVPPSRTSEVDFQRIWATSDTGGFLQHELKIGYSKNKNLSTELFTGRLKKSNEKSARYGGKINLSLGNISAAGNLELTELYSSFLLKWLKTSYTIKAGIKSAELAFSHLFESKNREKESSNRINELTPSITLRTKNDIILKIFYSIRNEKSQEAQNSAYNLSFSSSLIGTEIGLKRKNLLCNLNFSERISKAFSLSAATKSKARYLLSNLSYSKPEKQAFFRLFYNISTILSTSVEKYFERVQQGTGNYQYDPIRNEYIETQNGDYQIRARTLELGKPSLDIKMGFIASFLPLDLLKVEKLEGLVLNYHFDHEKNLPTESSPSIRFYFPQNPLDDKKITLGRLISKLGLLLPFGERNITNLDWRLESANDARTSKPEKTRDESISFGLTKKIIPNLDLSFYLEKKGIFRQINRTYYSNLNIKRHTIKPGITIIFQSSAEIGLNLTFSTEKELVTHTLACKRLASGLNASLPIFGGSFRGNIELSKVSVSSPNIYLPPEMAYGEQAGYNSNWNLSLDRRISDKLNFIIIYSGKHSQNQRTFHSLRMEGQFYF